MFQLSSRTQLLTAAVLAMLTVACGAGDQTGQAGAEAGPEAEAQAAPAVDPATAATVTGRIAFEGAPPAPQPIDMTEEPACAEKHAGGATTEEVVVGPDGGLANVFVYVKEGLTGSFPTPSQPVVLDQDGCIYEPHVLGLQVGQDLLIKNSDGLLHNINAKPTTNRGFNISQPTTMETTRSFSQPEVMIPVECDVHGWMRAYVGVLPHPYFAVSADDGSFTIPNLPPGDYVIEAWHERYGTQTQNVTVAAQETKELAFTYSEAMAENAVVPLGEPIDLHDHGTRGSGAHAAPAGAGR